HPKTALEIGDGAHRGKLERLRKACLKACSPLLTCICFDGTMRESTCRRSAAVAAALSPRSPSCRKSCLVATARPWYFRHHIYSAAALGKLPTPRMGSTSAEGL